MSLAAVVGAQFGDEGKGLVTDFLATPQSLVVRFNGGAQAGHTVVTPDGRRHVFSHIGSGAFRGATTLLSRYFLVNPILFAAEWDAVSDLRPHVLVDTRCPVTTPYDMLLNQTLEQSRGVSRHGSCGVGINETVTRTETPYQLRVADLLQPTRFREILAAVGQHYVPQRAHTLGIAPPTLTNDGFERFLALGRQFLDRVMLMSDVSAIRAFSDIVFEGAQGLRLDEVFGAFPYVTRSRTGLINVRHLLQGAHRPEPIDVYYVTRGYTTRHGAGPLVAECVSHPYGWTGPETNETGEFQGRFRYAPLDVDGLATAVATDLASQRGFESWTGFMPRPHLAVTCLDQLPDGRVSRVLDSLRRHTSLPVTLQGYGPTRRDVHIFTTQGVAS